MHRPALAPSLLASLGLLCAALAAPRPAHACGGFFCNRQPIEQSGERIVFAQEEDGTMTTHVQILYQGSATEFAWILPVATVPEISVGTDALFGALEESTRPLFTAGARTEGHCRAVPECPRPPHTPPPDPWGPFDASTAADAGPAAPPLVDVHFRGAVGPYDAAVIGSTDADAVRAWLADNGYDIPAAALPLLDGYVASRNVFVALKLLSDRAVGEIQPIVLRYRELQPCLPIKLTAIAATPDMPITAWVLGRARAVPYNYMDVRPDLEVKELYLGGGGPKLYQNLVSMAVDDAGGRGFVTDYAGAPPELAIAFAPIDAMRELTDPAAFVRELTSRGFAGDAQLLALLVRFVPPPPGIDAQSFYNDLINGWGDPWEEHLAGLDFDPHAFVDALEEAIVGPRREAQEMLGRHAKITRLFTTMDPAEMTEDPVFVMSARSADVPRTRTATVVTECSRSFFEFAAPQRIEYPTGGVEPLREGIVYPGTDAAYCEDARAGRFGPYVSWEEAARTADYRRTNPDVRARGCTASPSGAGGGAAAAVLLLVWAGARRRRRARR